MVEIREIFPIKGRTDFSKFVVLNDGAIHKGWQGNKSNVELYFDVEDEAIQVGLALVHVEMLNDQHMEDGFEPTKNY